MTISKTRLCESTLILAFSVFSFGYLGLFSRYRYLPSISIILIIAFLFILQIYPVRRRISVLWSLVLIYLTLSTLINNIYTGYNYLLIFVAAFLAYILSESIQFYLKLLNVFEVISLIFAIVTIINLVYPNIIIDVFGYMLTDGQKITILRDLSLGGYPGLAGEVSFNAFCLAIGVAIVGSKFLLSGKNKVLNICELLFLYFAVILTAKRSLIMVLPFVILCVFIMIAFKGKGIFKKILLLMIPLAIPILYYFYIGEVVERLLNKGGTTVDMSNRDWFWNIAFEMFNSKPIFGHGINTYDNFYNIYKSQSGYVYYAGAHNSYLQFFAELGFVGGTIYIISILTSLYITFRVFTKSIRNGNTKEQILITASITMQVICIFFAMSENTFYQPQQLFIYFLFVSIAINVKRQQTVNRNGAICNEDINCKST